jgi:hypothetical protein
MRHKQQNISYLSRPALLVSDSASSAVPFALGHNAWSPPFEDACYVLSKHVGCLHMEGAEQDGYFSGLFLGGCHMVRAEQVRRFSDPFLEM